MVKREVTVNLDGGLEATPTALLVQKASAFESSIYIEMKEGRKVNAKSIMGMMSLGAGLGDEVTITTEGSDEEEAAEALVNYLSGE